MHVSLRLIPFAALLFLVRLSTMPNHSTSKWRGQEVHAMRNRVIASHLCLNKRQAHSNQIMALLRLLYAAELFNSKIILPNLCFPWPGWNSPAIPLEAYYIINSSVLAANITNIGAIPCLYDFVSREMETIEASADVSTFTCSSKHALEDKIPLYPAIVGLPFPFRLPVRFWDSNRLTDGADWQMTQTLALQPYLLNLARSFILKIFNQALPNYISAHFRLMDHVTKCETSKYECGVNLARAGPFILSQWKQHQTPFILLGSDGDISVVADYLTAQLPPTVQVIRLPQVTLEIPNIPHYKETYNITPHHHSMYVRYVLDQVALGCGNRVFITLSSTFGSRALSTPWQICPDRVQYNLLHPVFLPANPPSNLRHLNQGAH
jgi:hypothetical protein